MEQINLQKVSEELAGLKRVVESIQIKLNFLTDKNDLIEIEPVNLEELSDEVIAEIRESEKAPRERFVSHEKVMAKFGK